MAKNRRASCPAEQAGSLRSPRRAGRATVHSPVTTTLNHLPFAGVIARKIKLPNQSGFATPSR
jgi:hypothetical protein